MSSILHSQFHNILHYYRYTRNETMSTMQHTNAEMDEILIDYNYKMNSSKRGICLIFNHEQFANLPSRKGTNLDRDRLRETFTSLQFKVKIFENESKQEIMRILEKGELVKKN